MKVIARSLMIVSLCLIVLLTACSHKEDILPPMPEDNATLRVIFPGGEQSFNDTFGGFLTAKFPQITFEVLDPFDRSAGDLASTKTPYERLIETIDLKEADLIITPMSYFNRLVDDGRLYSLESIIQSEQIPLDSFLPGFIDIVRNYGQGSIYGLAADYTSNALYYNIDLLEEHHMDIPKNQMSWEEIFELASRIGNVNAGSDAQVYGLDDWNGSSYDYLMFMASIHELRLLDAGLERFQLDTEGWRNIFKKVTDSIRDHGVYAPKAAEGLTFIKEDLFLSGKSAMSISNASLAVRLQQNEKRDKKAPFQWGVVSVPIHPALPDETPLMSFNKMMSITKNSNNKRIAWEMIKYLTSEEHAKSVSKQITGEIPIRTAFVKEIGTISSEPFTMLKPSKIAINGQLEVYGKLSYDAELWKEMKAQFTEAIEKVVSEEVDSNQALADLQASLQVKYDAMR